MKISHKNNFIEKESILLKNKNKHKKIAIEEIIEFALQKIFLSFNEKLKIENMKREEKEKNSGST